MSNKLALINGRVVDGTNRAPLENATILTEGRLFGAVGPSADIPLPEGCRVIDLQGKTVLPGLIDGHMHVTGMPGLADKAINLQDQLLASEILRDCLQWGILTIGHAAGCAENLVLRDLINKGSLKGRARLLVSGVVTATGGHVRGEGADGPWEIRRMVRRLSLAGMDFLKTCATGGFQWAHENLGSPDYTKEELQALTAEAKMRGLPIHVHAHAQPGLQNAIEAGGDVILHGANIDRVALQEMAARGLVYMPTLYITSEHVWGRKETPEHMSARMKAAYGAHREGLARAYELEIPIAAGTDGEPVPGALMHELCELVGCGLTPQEAIIAATRNTAMALGVQDRLGTVEPEKFADCVVIDGDPLADISLLTSRESIGMVIKEGSVEIDRLGASKSF